MTIWMLQTRISAVVQVDTRDLWPNVGIMIGGTAAYITVIMAAHSRLTRWGGWVLISCYSMYVGWQILSVWVFNIYGNRTL